MFDRDRPLTRESVAEEVDRVLVKAFGSSVTSVGPDVPLNVGNQFDSIDLLDSVGLIERHFGIVLAREDLDGLKTRRNLQDLVYRKLGGKERFAPLRSLLRRVRARALGRR